MAGKKRWNEPMIEILSVSDSTKHGGGIPISDGATMGSS